jgi:hypothetical protein
MGPLTPEELREAARSLLHAQLGLPTIEAALRPHLVSLPTTGNDEISTLFSWLHLTAQLEPADDGTLPISQALEHLLGLSPHAKPDHKRALRRLATLALARHLAQRPLVVEKHA